MARDTSVPVIFGVLTTDTMQRALECWRRAIWLELWRGIRDGQPDEGLASRDALEGLFAPAGTALECVRDR